MSSSNPIHKALFKEARKWQPDPDKISELLNKGASSSFRSDSGSTALHEICRKEPSSAISEILKIIISQGLDLQVKNESGLTPLHVACSKGNIDAVSILLENGADPNEKEDQGETPLHLAIFSSHEIVKLLLDKGANIDATDKKGNTPLSSMEVINERTLEIATALINNGANVNHTNSFGSTALHRAIQLREQLKMYHPHLLLESNKFIIALIMGGADPEIQDNLGNTCTDLDILGEFSELFKNKSEASSPRFWFRCLFLLGGEYYAIRSYFPIGSLSSLNELRKKDSDVGTVVHLSKDLESVIEVKDLTGQDFRMISLIQDTFPVSLDALLLLIYYYEDKKVGLFDFKNDPLRFCKASLELVHLSPKVQLSVLLQKEYFRNLDTDVYCPTADDINSLIDWHGKTSVERKSQRPSQGNILEYINSQPYDTKSPSRAFAKRIENFAEDHKTIVKNRVSQICSDINVINPKGRDRLEQKLSNQLDYIPNLKTKHLIRDIKDIFRGYIELGKVTDFFIEKVNPFIYDTKLKTGMNQYCALYLLLNIGDLSFELQIIPASILEVRRKAHDWYFLQREPTLDNLYIFLDKKCEHSDENHKNKAQKRKCDDQ